MYATANILVRPPNQLFECYKRDLDLNRLSSALLLLTLVSEQLLSDCCDSFALCFVHHGTGIVCSELTVLMLASGDSAGDQVFWALSWLLILLMLVQTMCCCGLSGANVLSSARTGGLLVVS